VRLERVHLLLRVVVEDPYVVVVLCVQVKASKHASATVTEETCDTSVHGQLRSTRNNRLAHKRQMHAADALLARKPHVRWRVRWRILTNSRDSPGHCPAASAAASAAVGVGEGPRELNAGATYRAAHNPVLALNKLRHAHREVVHLERTDLKRGGQAGRQGRAGAVDECVRGAHHTLVVGRW